MRRRWMDRARSTSRRAPTPAPILGEPDRPVEAVAEALVAAIDRGRRSLDADEVASLERIERHRAVLLADLTPIQLIDLKADPDAPPRELGSLTVAEICERAVSKGAKAVSLYNLARALRPRHVLEMGTSVGISAAYLATGLERAGTDGRLTTLEGAPEIAAIARDTLDAVGVLDRCEVVVGRFDETLAGTLDGAEDLDLVYLDGNHDEHATIAYLDAVAAVAGTGTAVVLDDIRWSEGMEAAWAAARAHPRTAWSLDRDRIGYLVLG